MLTWIQNSTHSHRKLYYQSWLYDAYSHFQPVSFIRLWAQRLEVDTDCRNTPFTLFMKRTVRLPMNTGWAEAHLFAALGPYHPTTTSRSCHLSAVCCEVNQLFPSLAVGKDWIFGLLISTKISLENGQKNLGCSSGRTRAKNYTITKNPSASNI